MMVLIDPRSKLAVQPGDISSMKITYLVGGGRALVLTMTSGQEIHIPGTNDSGQVSIDAVHAQLMEASK
jgi:hypothetical protein